MRKENPSAASDSQLHNLTSEVIRRFIAAFQDRDASAFVDLVAENCIMETMQPAPDGERVQGYDANVHFWQAMVTDSTRLFEVEDFIVCADRAIIRWRLGWGEGNEQSVRGVNLMRIQDGKIVEALAYAKTPLGSRQAGQQ